MLKTLLTTVLTLLLIASPLAATLAQAAEEKVPQIAIPAPATPAAAVPAARSDITLTFAPIVRKVAPAVVNIFTKRTIKTPRMANPFLDDPMLREFFGMQGMPEGQARARVQNALGSGVIVKPEGIVVTNGHVIKDADEISVVLGDKREYAAEVLTLDPHTDLAVLKLKAKPGETFPTLELQDSDEANVGDLVLAVGNPFGVGQTVTMGIISATARSAEVGSDSEANYFIQTDAAINPGNSGGALVSASGRLLGIPSAIYSRDGGSLGIGFAIPANLVKAILASKTTGGRIIYGWSGFEAQSLTGDIATSLGMSRPTGAIVSQLSKDSPAAKAGLAVGDVITAVNGHAVDDVQGLRFRLYTVPQGGSVTLKVQRKAETKEITFTMIAPPDAGRNEVTITGNGPLTGARVATLTPALSQELSLDDSGEGVVVLGVKTGSAAALIGFQRGDMIVAVNGTPVVGSSALQAALKGGLADRITVRRGGQNITLLLQ